MTESGSNPALEPEPAARDGVRLLAQFLRYGVVGALSVVSLTLVVVVLGHTVWPAFDSSLDASVRARNLAYCNVASFLVANLVAYLGNRAFVFTPGRHAAWLEFSLFTAVSAAGLLVGLFFGPLMIELYGLDSWLAQTLTIASAGVCNFLLRKFYIFSG